MANKRKQAQRVESQQAALKTWGGLCLEYWEVATVRARGLYRAQIELPANARRDAACKAPERVPVAMPGGHTMAFDDRRRRGVRLEHHDHTVGVRSGPRVRGACLSHQRHSNDQENGPAPLGFHAYPSKGYETAGLGARSSVYADRRRGHCRRRIIQKSMKRYWLGCTQGRTSPSPQQ